MSRARATTAVATRTLYRQCLRSVRRCPTHGDRVTMHHYARGRFDQAIGSRDAARIARLLAEGEEEVVQMEAMHDAKKNVDYVHGLVAWEDAREALEQLSREQLQPPPQVQPPAPPSAASDRISSSGEDAAAPSWEAWESEMASMADSIPLPPFERLDDAESSSSIGSSSAPLATPTAELQSVVVAESTRAAAAAHDSGGSGSASTTTAAEAAARLREAKVLLDEGLIRSADYEAIRAAVVDRLRS